MLTVSSSRGSVVRMSVAAIDLSCNREVDGLSAEWLGATQWIALPVIGQHDAPQVGVPFEADAEQIEQLALVPVRPRDGWRQAGRLGVSACFEPQPGVQFHRIEEVDQLKAILALQTIDGRQVHETRVLERAADALYGWQELCEWNANCGDAVGGHGDGLRAKPVAQR